MNENEIPRTHPVVMATIVKLTATAELRAEQLRSRRSALATVSAGQQNRAIALGKALREADAIASSWRHVAELVHDDSESAVRAAATVVCPSDCDYCHHEECPCPRMGCAGDPDRADDE